LELCNKELNSIYLGLFCFLVRLAGCLFGIPIVHLVLYSLITFHILGVVVVVIAVAVVGRSFVVVDSPVFVKIHFSWSLGCCYLPAVSTADFDLDLGS
jgi:hypothetical protein